MLLRMVIAVCLSISVAAAIQSQPQKREIISHDFTNNRQNAAPEEPVVKGSQRQSRNRTRYTSKPPRPYRLASSAMANVTDSDPASIKQLGLTIWRLRPVSVNDQGPKLSVIVNGASSERVPERTEADTKFQKGDHVRLSIESPHPGYLYVVNREMFADGTTGSATLIYPWAGMFRGENRVQAGRVIDIPAQDDNPSYFTANPTRPDQIAELLTFIVTKTPLNLPLSNETVQISDAQMAQWEKRWRAQNERFELEGGAGETWTKQEQQAALRVRPRRLTRDDPAPQTIYRVTASNRLAFLVNVRLSYR